MGVMGSAGKTTTSWLIRGIFEELGQLTGMLGAPSPRQCWLESRAAPRASPLQLCARDAGGHRGSPLPFLLCLLRMHVSCSGMRCGPLSVGRLPRLVVTLGWRGPGAR